MHFGQFNLLGYRTRRTRHALRQRGGAGEGGRGGRLRDRLVRRASFLDYCVIPSRLKMVAPRGGDATDRARAGVVVAPLYHPVRLLSEIGMVEALTHGRLVLGVGRTWPTRSTRRSNCITDDRTEAARFVDDVRHQIRLSQSLRYREEILDGAMLIEKPYVNESPIEELAANLPVGDAQTVAERLVDIIRAAEPRHILLQFQAGNSDQRLALRSIDHFASTVVPLIERAVGPLATIGDST